ncbi:hypothetical protein [Helicobacter pylori]|uniref:hypothetical protein n=1 Tax=Helicobacter pylori TaxID=210 RepID=UPI0039FCD148
MVLYHYYFKTPKSFPLEYLHLCANESHLLRLDFDAAHFSHNTFLIDGFTPLLF